MQDWLVQGITATVSGMLTVFVVLILIAFVISKFKHLNAMNQVAADDSKVKKKVHIENKQEEDEEVVAAIMAVISMMSKETGDKLVVRRIKRRN